MSDQLPHNDDELLSAYIDGELSDEERARVEERLANDATARQTVAELRELSAALQAAPRETLGRDLRASLWAAIDRPTDAAAEEPATIPLATVRDSAERKAGRRRGLVWAALAIAASLMLAVFVRDEPDQRAGRDLAKVGPRADAPEVASAPVEPEPPAGAAAEGETLAFSDGDFATIAAMESRAGGAVDGAFGGRSMDRAADLRSAPPASSSAPALGSELAAVSRGREPGPSRLVQVRLVQPAAASRFEELLVANSIQLVDDAAVAEPPTSPSTLALESTAPDSSPSRGAMLSAGAQMSEVAEEADEMERAAVAGVAGGAASAPAQTYSATPPAESKDVAVLSRRQEAGRGAIAEQLARDQVAAVLVDAPPSQIDTLIYACASDSLNFAVVDGQTPASSFDKLTNDALATGNTFRAELSDSAQQQNRRLNQQQGRALRFAVPRALAESQNAAELDAVVQDVVERDRRGAQNLWQAAGPAAEAAAPSAAAAKAIDAPGGAEGFDAESPIRVLFLLDAQGAAPASKKAGSLPAGDGEG